MVVALVFAAAGVVIDAKDFPDSRSSPASLRMYCDREEGRSGYRQGLQWKSCEPPFCWVISSSLGRPGVSKSSSYINPEKMLYIEH